jgi:hypothetical protein
MTDSPRRLRVGDRETISPRGKKQIWCTDFSLDGLHHRQSLKTRTQKIAVQRAVRLGAELGCGKHVVHHPAGRTTVRQSVADYLAYLETEGRARKTVVRYCGELTALCDFLEAHRASWLAQTRTARHPANGPGLYGHEGRSIPTVTPHGRGSPGRLDDDPAGRRSQDQATGARPDPLTSQGAAAATPRDVLALVFH